MQTPQTLPFKSNEGWRSGSRTGWSRPAACWCYLPLQVPGTPGFSKRQRFPRSRRQSSSLFHLHRCRPSRHHRYLRYRAQRLYRCRHCPSFSRLRRCPRNLYPQSRRARAMCPASVCLATIPVSTQPRRQVSRWTRLHRVRHQISSPPAQLRVACAPSWESAEVDVRVCPPGWRSNWPSPATAE